MKTIPVSLIVAGVLVPMMSFAQPEEGPQGPPQREGWKDEGRRPFLKAWKAADKNEDGFISNEEFEQMPRIQGLPEDKRARLFARFDKNGDGKLDRDELGRFGKPHGDRRHPMPRFWELDADKSGGVSFEEFKAGRIFAKLAPEEQQAVFRNLDTNGDGMISPKDRPEPPFERKGGRVHPRHQGGPPMDPGQIIRRLDQNGDGALSFEEFRKGPAVRGLSEDEQEDRFEKLDQNQDLKITAEEFPLPRRGKHQLPVPPAPPSAPAE